jgi:hypothetical protein
MAKRKNVVKPFKGLACQSSDVTMPTFETIIEGGELPLFGKVLAFSVMNRPAKALARKGLDEVEFVTLANIKVACPRTRRAGIDPRNQTGKNVAGWRDAMRRRTNDFGIYFRGFITLAANTSSPRQSKRI